MKNEKLMYQKYIDSVITFLTLFQKIGFENDFENNINYLIDNGYGFLI
jgi:hypothetical protein